uniref:NADH dehydrogenase subunit 11 n=1 Tax=Heterosigma akashiwo TaxID=2829 RepID=A0A1D8GXJ6_HETAK|nr:NADH dehydrogenase subunit 11 [Heterosigma akashiwo]BBE28054.1 NADH dehydrogenase subunit 11 [Heterosigma akashiwo]
MKVYINNIEVEVAPNTTVLEACSVVGIDVPRFCYHQELSVAGNCRMCLVEIEKAPKPVAACAMPVSPNMKVFTDTPLVKKAREGVLEFLLLNHPLDCPICDQGGECDLQEQVMVYGSDRSRFYEVKRSVEDKNCGPLIKTIMTRCIHCTRCVRFAAEVAGVPDLGTTNRGQDTEIGTFIEKTIQTELSGNLVDLCPVGALTSKPYAFNARPWEIRSVESIDVFDGVGSNIRVDFKEAEIIRVLPRANQEINKEWITDKVRFSYDGLKQQRLTQPLQKSATTWEPLIWADAIQQLSEKLNTSNPNKIGIVVGNGVDSETALSAKHLASALNISKFSTDRMLNVDADFSNAYSLAVNKINETDCCLLVGTDPRLEASLLNLRLQQNNRRKNAKIFSIGGLSQATFPITYLGSTLKDFVNFLEGKHPICVDFKKAKSPLIIYGTSLLDRVDTSQFQSTLLQFNDSVKMIPQNSINLLHSDANQVGHLNLGIPGFSPELLKDLDVLYLIQPSTAFLNYLNDYKLQISEASLTSNAEFNPFVVYQGHHFPFMNSHLKNCEFERNIIVDLLLPGKTFVEKEGTFFNTENRCQKTSQIFKSVSNIQNREDWQILQCLSEKTKLRSSAAVSHMLSAYVPNSANVNQVVNCSLEPITVFKGLKLYSTPLKPLINDFYLTHPISQASTIMGKCSSAKRKWSHNYLVSSN